MSMRQHIMMLHILDKRRVLVRYYGLYAEAYLGKVEKASGVPVALGMFEEIGDYE